MASAIFFGGRRINIPQAASKIDASALAGVSPSAVGIVALIGTAEGGKPLTIDPEFADHTRAESVLETYRSGDLRVAGQFAFAPSLDDAVPGGAQRLVCVKVNPATQATVTLPDDDGGDSIVLTSVDYGLFANQLNVTIADGTNTGKRIVVSFEDQTETFDDVGGTEVFDLLYTPGTEGYDTALATLTDTLLSVAATKAETGLTTERTADVSGATTLLYASTDAGDTASVTVYGLNGTAAVRETVRLTGTVAVAGTQTFTKVLGAVKSAATTGTVTVLQGATTLFSLAPATLTRGVVLLTNAPAAGAVAVTIDAAAAVDVAVFGTSATGAAVGDRYDMTAGGTVAGTTTFGGLTVLALGDVAGARTVTIGLTAVSAPLGTYNTIQKLADLVNGRAGFSATVTVRNPSTYDPADLDSVTDVSLLTAHNFMGDLAAIVAKINGSSAYLNATAATGATAAPANTASAVYLTGGGEGTVTSAEWLQAFTLLKQRRVNIIVPLTRDPAIHALLASHLVERAGKLRSEANGYIGIAAADLSAETRANIKAQIQALGTRHITAVAEECMRADPDTLEETWFPPYIYAAIAAGMQAGSAIGEPLTHKRPLITDVRRHSSWTVEDDAEEMIDSGLMFSEKRDGIGIRWVRSVTTHLADDNVVFTETSANAAANHAVYELRRAMEQRIGKRGLAGSAATLKGLAADVLNRLITDEIIVAWKSLQVEQVGDVFPVSVELAPVLPINFIPITVHLVAVRQAA